MGMNDFVQIQTPDGRTVRFPKGMSRADMAAALNSLPPAGAAPSQPKSFGQTFRENLFGDNDPTTQNFGEKVGTFLNKAGESMTFGLVGDETSAAVESALGIGAPTTKDLVRGDNRSAYERRRDHYRDQEALLEQSNPGAALTADIGGALVGAVTPAGAIGTLGRGAGMLPRIGASMAAGAGMGGTYGLMEGEGTRGRITEALKGAGFGALGGAAAPVLGAGAQKVADALVQRGPIRAAVKSAQTAAGQRAAARGAYNAFGGEDVQMTLPAFRRMTQQVDEAMRAVEPSPNIPGPLGKPSKSYSKITKSLTGMDDVATAAGGNPATTGIRLGAVEAVRKAIGPLAREVNQNFRPTQGAVSAQRATGAIDAMMDNLQPEDIISGDKDAALSALKKARELWRMSIKTQKVENAIEAADDYLSGSASGIRNQFKSLLRRDRKENLFTEAERAFLKKAIGGNMISRAVRLVGDGIGRRAALFTGGALGGLEGAAIGGAAGEIASQIGDAAALKNAELARALVSSGALNNLPVATDSTRRLLEALVRRSAAAIPH